jgi:uncharacterized protein (DUF302 family)
MRTASFSLVGLVLNALVLAAPPSWADAPKVEQSAPGGVYKVAIDRSISMNDAAESLKLRANTLNLQLVAELPMSKQVEAITGKPQRTIIIYQFCDAVLARDLIDVNMEFAIYMPCRIALIEDAQGQGWLVMMDVSVDDVAQEMRLPPELKARIEKVRNALIDIMGASARGDL